MKSNALLTSLFVLLSTLSALAGGDKVFKNADKWIPADFDTRKGVLLVEKWHVGRQQKIIDKVYGQMDGKMKESYPYKYEIVDFADLKDTKYNDKDQYRYVIRFANSMNDMSNSGGVTSADNDFYIYDRKQDKKYPLTMRGTAYPKDCFDGMINTIVARLKSL